ncbi:hypothetical protein [Candidatus Contubernalis alkaliaceticus]|uniref:hypothetical protein n=1 Tax=Candidatus Contubernalis alkaliaceticus TaxID=338645 RepID=UPI001F4BDEBE|nr:hypothetical protein [Candidatus Contubernalis alkalaceticus]UNC92529.1 hypothetical protein HUE98_10725 [Candidatus Contubernalis alkalaceticus]
MRMVSFVKFNPRYIMLFKILVILLVMTLIVPKVLFIVKEIISPGAELEGPADTRQVDQKTFQEGFASFWDVFWYNLQNFYRQGINI